MSCHNAINGRIQLKHLKKGENDSKIGRGANIIGALSYNQLKVDQENGSILSTHRIRETVNGQFTVNQLYSSSNRI
jgi:hypothetical protein